VKSVKVKLQDDNNNGVTKHRKREEGLGTQRNKNNIRNIYFLLGNTTIIKEHTIKAKYLPPWPLYSESKLLTSSREENLDRAAFINFGIVGMQR